MPRKRKADIQTTWTESFVLVRPVSTKGREWMLDNFGEPQRATSFAGSLPVEHRYFPDIAHGAVADGLLLQDTESGRFSA